jgi:hypothetical protein
MATYSAFPVFVDGVRLDSSAWNVESKVRQWAGARSADVVLPGVDGVAASLNDDLEPTLMTLSMWVVGTDENGLIPNGSNGMAQCRANLDQLSALFGVRHRLISIIEVVDAAGTQRQANAKVVDSISPEVRAGGLGRFTVTLQLPEAMWQDPATSDWSQSSVVAGNTYEVTSLQGSTGPVADGILTFTGPATNPQLTDFNTGAYARLNVALTAGQVWRLNCATWATQYGSGLTFASADTAGTSGQPATVFGGGTARFLRMQPTLNSGARRVSLTVTGSGFTSATAIGVRARRKYLQ